MENGCPENWQRKMMPLSKNVRYRWKTTKSGKKVRLAFKDGDVIEVKKRGGRAHKVKKGKKK